MGVSGPVALVYGDALMKHHLSDAHPLQPIRVKLAVDLIRSTGLIEHAHLLPPRAATIEELELVHSPEYVELVQRLSDPKQRTSVSPAAIDAAGYASADNPTSDELHDGSALVAGATLVAAEAIQSGMALHAFSPSGGLHHAHRDRASPQDSGVGKGRGFAVNLPFAPYTWDEPWLGAFEKVVPAMLRRFKPTVLVTQDGCDTHHLDPLAHLSATTRIWPRIGRVFHELAHELCDGRWLALGGGGYAIYEVVPRAWTLLFAEMVEHPELAAEVDDPATVVPAVEAQERVWNALRNDLRRLGEVHGLEL